MDLSAILKSYDPHNLTIVSLGGHSALDVCAGAKKDGFKTLVVAQKGREKTYKQYYRTRPWGRDGTKGCIDDVIVVKQFSDILKPKIQADLRARNAIVIGSRYFWVYFKNFEAVENDFKVPIYGNRSLVKLEERDHLNNQYVLLKKAGIRIPKMFKTPKSIDRLVLVKVSEAKRGYERAFFFASSHDDYKERSAHLLHNEIVTKDALKKATIEEYILGAQVNFNYFYSNMNNELELMGTDTRRQTNLDGILRLPANQQMDVLNKIGMPKMIETGHVSVTVKESLLEKAFVAGEKFVATLKKEAAPGMIGPFALQGAIAAEEGREEIVIFDVSMRIPGSPGTRFTPYSAYLYGDALSYGERIAMEISQAVKQKRLGEILT